MIYTAYAAPRMDYFTAITVPCTYQPAPCSDFPVDEQEKCKEHKKLFDQKCSETSGFWSKYASKHICSQENYNAGNLVQPDGGRMRWTPSETFSGDSADDLVGGCNCDYSVQTRNGTVAATKGVPDNFIKEGMSTFYVQVLPRWPLRGSSAAPSPRVQRIGTTRGSGSSAEASVVVRGAQVVVGGRKTYAEDDAECQCTGPQDTSAACMCALGTRKVPYVYNNAFVPYLTALVSVKSGRLVYTNTYVRYNFEENGIGCVACSKEYCWGSPEENLKGWIQASPQLLKVADPKICAIPRVPVSGEAVPFCRYPASDRDIDMCSLKVYVAWVGTDGFGQGCDSHNKMFSRFTQMGVSNVAVQFYDGISSLVFNVEARITGRDGAVIT